VIYTQKGKATHVISKVAIRMKKWLLYVMPTVEKAAIVTCRVHTS